MRHILFTLIVGVYILAVGQNWTWYAAELIVAAYRLDDGRLPKPT